MISALAAAVALTALIPARWNSADPATLELVRMTPVNCLLIEQPYWSTAFNQAAGAQGIAPWAVVRPGSAAKEAAARAATLGFAGIVFEGDFGDAPPSASLPAIEITLRSQMRLDGKALVVGTYQGVWPGIQIQEDGKAKAAPSGAAWIDTNTGFLRFMAAATKSTMWIANQPPTGFLFPPQRYQQAVADAAMSGARWVVALDSSLFGRLVAREAKAVEAWRSIGSTIAFFEEHPEWRAAEPFARLALVEDRSSGAMLSGGILDMIATRHTPVRPVPRDRLSPGSLEKTQLAVDVDPASLSAEQREALRAFTRGGGTLLTGPPNWKFPELKRGEITLAKDDVKRLDDIWRDLNALTGRKNLGARLFNVSSMLSNVVELKEPGEVVVHLVNYSDYPVENVTVHVLGKYRSAKLLAPGGKPVAVEGYDIEEGTGFDLDKVGAVATLVLEKK